MDHIGLELFGYRLHGGNSSQMFRRKVYYLLKKMHVLLHGCAAGKEQMGVVWGYAHNVADRATDTALVALGDVEDRARSGGVRPCGLGFHSTMPLGVGNENSVVLLVELNGGLLVTNSKVVQVYALIGAFFGDHGLEGARQNQRVQHRRPILYVVEVQAD